MQNSEQNFRNLFQNAAQSVAVVQSGKVKFGNPMLEKTTGYTITELAEMDALKLIHPDDRERILSYTLRRQRGEPVPSQYRLRYFNKAGELRWLERSISDITWKGEKAALVIDTDITENVRTDEELKDNEEQLKASLKNAPDGVYINDFEGQFLYSNRRCDELIGYNHDELIGKRFFDLNILSEEDLARAGEILRRNIRGESTGPDEFELFRKDGKRIPVEINTSLVQRMGQTVVLAFVRDITERKRAEQELNAREIKFRELFQNMSSGVVFYEATANGEDFIITDFNYAAEKIEKIRKEDVVGRGVLEVFPGVKNFGIFNVFQRVYQTGKAEHFPVAQYHDDRISGWRENYIFKLPSGEVVAVYDDVTERKQAEEQIIRSKALLQTVIDSTPDRIAVKDRNYRYLLVNRSLADSYGAEPREIVERPDSDFLSEEQLMGNPKKGIRSIREDDKIALSGRTVRGISTMKYKRGDWRVFDAYRVPLKDSNGNIYGILAYNRDITELYNATEDLKKSYEKVQVILSGIVSAIATICETRDPYTAGHQNRTSQLACAIAAEMGMSDEMLSNISTAAKLHDIGKLYVPAEILSKPGKLTEIELAIVRNHPQVGYEIVSKIEFPGIVPKVILQHHERLDGSGYPYGLTAGELAVEAKIMAVADVVEAMSSHRPYRPSLGIETAIEEINRNKGTLYDETAVDVCTRLFHTNKFKFD